MGAGLGFKTFVTGDVLTATDTNGYLMQGVWVFADAAARSAAVTSPQEGNMSFLKDTNSVEYYSGSAWVAVGASSASNTFYAGKNKIINGNFGVWQRGTSGFTFGGAFNADRFQMYADGTGVTRAITQQTFTPGTAPVSGYEGTYYFRYAQTVAGTGGTLNRFYQKVEDVRAFAGQTVALSFWAKADAARSITAALSQNFGSGGSGSVTTAFSGTASVTTSWQRFTFSVAVPSISGKTVGTSSYLEVDIDFPLNTTQTIEIWGVQLEAGSTATDFQTASGSVGGELALCQRYYQRTSVGVAYSSLSDYGNATSTTNITAKFPTKVTMRVTPTSLDYSNLIASADEVSSSLTVTAAVVAAFNTPDCVYVGATVAGATQYRPYKLFANNTNGYIGLSAEL